MKTNFKRLAALVLTLCMLATLMVPVAFAEDAAVESPAASVSAAETYPIRLVDLTQTDYNAAAGYSKWFKGGNAWKPNIAMAAIAGYASDEYATGNLDWLYIGSNDSKYNYYNNIMMQPRLTDANSWAALKIRVSEDGRYALNLHTDKTNTTITDANGEPIWSNSSSVINWKGDVTAYIIPLADYNTAIAAGAEVNAAIESLMTDANCVGTKTLAADETDVTFNKVRMAEGEYVVVYSATAGMYCISEMTLLEDAADAAMYEINQVVTYPIRFGDPNKAPSETTGLQALFGSSAYGNKAISALSTSISAAYDDDTLNWKYLAEEASASAYYRKDVALQLRSAANKHIALQVKVEDAGFYFPTVGIDRTTTNAYVSQTASVSGIAFNVTAYLVNTKDLTEAVTADNIASLAVDANSLGVASLAADASTAKFEGIDLEAGEYVLIYKLSATACISEFGLAQRKIDMPLTSEGASAVTQTIDFGLYDIDDSVFSTVVNDTSLATEVTTANGEATTLGVYADAAYANGTLDWKIEAYPETFTGANFAFRKTNDVGLKVLTPADTATDSDWFAVRIRVKESSYYNLSINCNDSTRVSASTAVYMFAADGNTMTADQIKAKMIPENGIYYNGNGMVMNPSVSVGYLEGEYILAFYAPLGKSAQVYISDITLVSDQFTEEDVQFYNFNFFDETNTGYYDLIANRYTAETVDGVTTYTKADAITTGRFDNTSGVVLTKDADGNPTLLGELYKAVYLRNGLGYPGTLNWRPDAAHTKDDDTIARDMKVYGFNSSAIYLGFIATSTDTQYGSIMVHVDKAGTYNLNIAVGGADSTAKIYFVDSFAENAKNAALMPQISDATVQSIMTNRTGLLSNGYTQLPKSTTVDMGQVTVDAAGDFLIIFEADPTAIKNIQLNSITLTPVVQEVEARINGVEYASLVAAIADAEAGDTITLTDNVVVADVELGENVTLNLNGYALTADSVDAAAPGAQVIDSGDGIAKLRAVSLELNEDNAQLPLYNGVNDYYCFYNVEVQAVATTGKANDTMYWFKVNFSNSAALDLFEAGNEMDIQISMTGVYKDAHELAGQAFAATATAQAEFVLDWAAKSTSYIVVSTVGSNGLDKFVLNPEIAANGVVISGDDMVRGV